MRALTHIRVRVCVCVCVCTHLDTFTHTHTHTHPCSHTCTLITTHTDIHTYIHTGLLTRTHTSTHAHAHSHGPREMRILWLCACTLAGFIIAEAAPREKQDRREQIKHIYAAHTRQRPSIHQILPNQNSKKPLSSIPGVGTRAREGAGLRVDDKRCAVSVTALQQQ